MEELKTYEEWKKQVDAVLISKAEELRMMGYQQTTKNDVWECLHKKVWKTDEKVRIHKIVQDILHLSSSTYISFLTMEAYEDEDLRASIQAISGWSEQPETE